MPLNPESVASGLILWVVLAIVGYILAIIADTLGAPHPIGTLVFLLFVLLGAWVFYGKVK